jgi:hypothetical protein
MSSDSKAQRALADMRDVLVRVREGRFGPSYDAGVRDGRASRDTEVEALRAEVERLRRELKRAENYIGDMQAGESAP